MLTALLSLCGILSAAAEGSGTKEDPYVFENGASYKIEAMKGFYGKFTAPADGRITITKTNFAVYTDETFSTIDEEYHPEFGGSFENVTYSIKCKAGKTYYIGNDFVMNAAEMTFTFREGSGAEPLMLTEVSPAEGSVFDVGHGLVELTFNQNIMSASVTMDAGKATNVSFGANAHGAYISVDVKNKLHELYDKGDLKDGDDIKFTFSGVAPTADPTALYNGTGVIEIAYKAGPKPLTLLKSAGTPTGTPAAGTFLSYYMKGGNDGVITLEFSGDVNMSDKYKPQATLLYGNSESEDEKEFYTEMPEVRALNGNTIVLDMRGKLRRAKDMVASGTDYGSIRLRVANVHDTNGNYAYSEGSGTLGTFDFMYEFEDVTYTTDTDWSLSDGDNVTVIGNGTKSVILWLRENGGSMTFDGAKFTYTDKGTEKTTAVALSGITVTDEGDGERTITIPMPEISADAGSCITVALTGAERPDGITTAEDAGAFDYLTKTFTTTGRGAGAADGISGITMTEGGRTDVYTLDGKLLLKNADAGALKRLGKDVYIVNGKKVIIK